MKMETSGYISLGDPQDDEDDRLDVDEVRKRLDEKNEMVVGVIVLELLKHSSAAITHADRSVLEVCSKLSRDALQTVWTGVSGWMRAHPIQTVLMIVGLGTTAFKAQEMALFMTNKMQSFIAWSLATNPFFRLIGFIGLMMARLFISTLIPPTSPGFSMIMAAATPADEKWTAMPFFLIASTVAGILPWFMDQVLEFLVGEWDHQKSFMYTRFMKWFAAKWPLTCWTEPVMRKVFEASGGGKKGATYAVIVAHAAPFMGAQTTNLQRYFLPHPLDTILSQPFGMSEDLLTMALAEARTNPMLASQSLTVIIVALNLVQAGAHNDAEACFIFLLNCAVGMILTNASISIVLIPSDPWAFVVVGTQFVVQLLVVPFIIRKLAERIRGHDNTIVENVDPEQQKQQEPPREDRGGD